MSSVPAWLSFSFIALVALMYSLMLIGLLLAKARAEDDSQLPLYVIRICVGGFLLVTGLLGLQGFFLRFDNIPPRILVAVLIAFAGVLIFVFHPKTKGWLRNVPQSWLIGLQTFRLPLEIQLFYLAQTPLLPKVMTYQGRNFDILIGLTAPLLAFWVYRQEKKGTVARARPMIFAWNVFGILLVTNVAVHGVLTAPTPIRQAFEGPPNLIVGVFPFVWLPTFLVPLALLLHFLSLRKARIEAAA